VRVTDEARLRELATGWEEKYGGFRHVEVREGHFHHGPGRAAVYSVAPRTVFGFGEGEPFSRTRWPFARRPAPMPPDEGVTPWTSPSKSSRCP
jgi:hypothetical protein